MSNTLATAVNNHRPNAGYRVTEPTRPAHIRPARVERHTDGSVTYTTNSPAAAQWYLYLANCQGRKTTFKRQAGRYIIDVAPEGEPA